VVAGLDFDGIRQVEIARRDATDAGTRVTDIVGVGGPLGGGHVDIAGVCPSLCGITDGTPVDWAIA
jgi:hypothetical protein